MLTERLPDHQYIQTKDLPSLKQCRNVILINKQTQQSSFCASKPLTIDENNRLCFSDLINDLKPQYPELHRAFFFLCINNKEYLVGADPFTSPRNIDFGMLEDQEIIILYNEQKHHKKKEAGAGGLQSSSSTDNSSDVNDLYVVNKNDEFQQVPPSNIEEKVQKEIQKYVKPREKRVKERTIEYVIEKVKKWRDIYENGIKNELGEHIKPNLDVSAYLVQLSRKTLDDYYAQLRKGEMYGFDFQKYKHEKMGTLRKYVKEQQKTNPNRKNKGKLEEIETIQEDQENQQSQQQLVLPKVKQEELEEPKYTFNLKVEQDEVEQQEMQRVKIEEPQSQSQEEYFDNNYTMEMEEEVQQREHQINQFIVNDEYDYLMKEILRQSPMKSHKGSTDVCDIFMDLNNNNNDSHQMEME